jgi:hypothetical protein
MPAFVKELPCKSPESYFVHRPTVNRRVEVRRRAKAYTGKATASGIKKSPHRAAQDFIEQIEHLEQLKDWSIFRLNASRSFVLINEDEVIFRGLASNWKRATGHFSVLSRRYRHPSYRAILNMGQSVVPFILRELRREPDRWFDALERLTGANPAKGATNFYEAVDCWIAWGVANRYLS